MSEQFRIRHYFDPDWDEGGYTVVTDMTQQVIGVAVCSPHDKYSRKHGVRLAKERIEMLKIARPENIDEGTTVIAIMAPRVKYGDWKVSLSQQAISTAVDHAYRHFPELDSVMVVMQPSKE
jgi:hypothetical protein